MSENYVKDLKRKTMAGPPPEGWRRPKVQLEDYSEVGEDGRLYTTDEKFQEYARDRHDEIKATYAIPTTQTIKSPGWIEQEEAAKKLKESGSDHYKNGGVEPWDLIHSAKLNFDEGNVVKYVCRHRRKDGITDLKKAMTYLKALALQEYGEEL